MNFKILLISFIVSACGVKGDPSSPKTPVVPSLIQNYPDIQTEKPLDDVKKSAGKKRRR